MAEILVFSGTSEGRQFTERLNEAGLAAVCFVATEYGEIVMKPHPLCEIRQGRLTPDRMRETFLAEDPKYIVDATHPYAVEVTANIRRAAEEAGMAERYLRLSREREAADEALLARFPDCEIVPDAAAAAARCCALEGNIFLTTGVRELSKFMAYEELADRLTARILPSMDSLRIAAESGIRSGALICMEGPFDEAVNIALFKRSDARVMVTKNSGARGGFEEKLLAAKALGIHTIIIDSGVKDRGMSGEQILTLLGVEVPENVVDEGNVPVPDRAAEADTAGSSADTAAPEICIVGIGVGRRELLTGEALSAIERADLLIGAARMLEFASEINPRAKAFREYAPEKVKEILLNEDYRTACVLMSGDTGFFSGAAGVRAALEKEGRAVRLVPGISSLVYFAAKTGIPYSEASVISLHGQDTDVDEAILARDRLFSILTGPEDIARVCEAVIRLRGGGRVRVGKDLGSADEAFWEFDAAEMPAFPEKGLYIMNVTDYGR